MSLLRTWQGEEMDLNVHNVKKIQLCPIESTKKGDVVWRRLIIFLGEAEPEAKTRMFELICYALKGEANLAVEVIKEYVGGEDNVSV